ncbi:bifunctional phosphopantothenoylcysteine decarboxylase/phosphopantothenate--cysteine ligase CoaBC [Geomicrobium sp. JCM 19038]|uniref:bifunctional phosphopantothenoylcysteine decarboxylase/phosphopantothenate--cysteine ligase CoaBC n=1 Tax=Geomicrobium sp. JCM 19038 TaxID=1460635 RepID=UPI00045F4AD4|nr:bifunctional phosphopantothenoylcysteine decarboxylase/phosphopantothenate--cysteine ligase CoaBC [Geomicrobium sp. JCM 19038]GAK07466.1 phosphopantothenoylcysteine decarboxylase [Geomicrobium sp. JCM 19038]
MDGKKIVLGVTGGVAAFKAAALASKLKQAGASVKTIMTESSKEFVTPLTFQALTRDRVYDNTFVEEDVSKIAHIDVADWADAFVIVPATANFIGKYANGIADDMLTSTLLATKAPVYVAPAMNVNMYDHPAVIQNLETLMNRGVTFIEPGAGYLACGWIGKGRLAEPEDILNFLHGEFSEQKEKTLKGKNVLITAGPTREVIDPVRFLSNRSTGKMGYAIAKAAIDLGAKVTLVSGPVHLEAPQGVTLISVTSAEEMYEQVMKHFDDADFVIKTAAVSDYRPTKVEAHKVKKQAGNLTIEMERTKDILRTLGENKHHQVLVGFAAETQDVETYAKEKLERKRLDLIVANDVSDRSIGFESDENRVLLIDREGGVNRVDQQKKETLAYTILENASKLLREENHRVRESHR